MKEIVLIGGGGHCISCIDVIEHENIYKIAGIVDQPEHLHKKVMGYEIFGCDDDLPVLVKEYPYFFITIGQIESPAVRTKMFETLITLNAALPVIVSPNAYVSKHAQLGQGTIVMHKALVNANAIVGENCIINTGAIVEHDADVGNHCHISTSATVNGGVVIGDRSFIGSNAVTREGVALGSDVFIGCNERVTQDVLPQGRITSKERSARIPSVRR